MNIKIKTMGEKFQLNHYYLIKRRNSSLIQLVKIVTITNKTFYVQWNNGNYTWEDKKVFFDYIVVENITEQYPNIPFEIKQEPIKTRLEYEPCGFCGGTGQVPDDRSTAGTKTCPVCFGMGTILKTCYGS